MSETPTWQDSAGSDSPPTWRDPPQADPNPTIVDDLVGGRAQGGGTHQFPAELRPRLSDLRPMHPASRPGGSATLYRARWDGQREVVVKVYPAGINWQRVWELGQAPAGQEQLHREASAEREQIWHRWRETPADYAVTLHYACAVNDNAYEVTSFLPAGTLAARAGQRMPLDVAEQVVAQLAEALRHLHEPTSDDHSFLVHGDLKPGNILVASAEPLRVCLTDFGATRVLTVEPERAAAAELTPEYAAPELLRNARCAAGDWWSLGITVLELVQGFHPLATLIRPRPEEPNTRLDHLATISNTVHDHPISIGPDLPSRWQQLVRGLLTRDWQPRWGYQQVRDWLAGQDVWVSPEAWPEEEANRPFEFAGEQVYERIRLAELMAAHWQATAELLLGRRWPELLAWAASVGPRLGESLAEITVGSPVDRAVAELLVRLDPEAPPTFRGYPVDEGGLLRLAAAALRNEHGTAGQATETGDAEPAPELRAVLSLQASGALRALSRLSGQSRLGYVEERWQHWWWVARAAAEAALGNFDRLPGRQQLPAVLLRAAVDPAYPAALAEQARRLVTPRTRRVAWFRRLAREAVGPDAPARHAVLILLAGQAEEPQLPRPTPGTEAAEQVRQLRAEVDAQIARAGPPHAPDGWLPAPAAVAQPAGTRRYHTGRQRRALAGLATLAALGYLALVVVAGIGIGAGTAAVQGTLVAVLLLLAGGCLAAGLLLPRSPLTEAALGAVAGGLGGLLVAGLLGVTAGFTAGPGVGWPVFWTTWVAVTTLGAAMGAAEWKR